MQKMLCALLISSLVLSCRVPDNKKYEIRAVWMSRFEYAQDKSATESREYIKELFHKFAKAGLNTVVFQVRGNADALYQSSYEPWSDLLSDTLGQNPGWDPLDFALQEAKRHGLQLHAWINTFPAWRAQDPPPTPSTPLHPLLAHPEWVICDSSGAPMQPEDGYISFSPGIPAVQQHIQDVVKDIVINYDVDGIHFDYIRYPENSVEMGYSHDSISIERFKSFAANPGEFSWESFQREQINHFVQTTYNQITALKPWIVVSAAVIGFHHTAGWNGYSAVFQDARRWAATGKIDIIFPMTYQKIGHPSAPFDGALAQWAELIHLGRYIVPGIATYRAEKQFGWPEIWDQIELVRKERFSGMIFFSAQSVASALDQLHESYYHRQALQPPLPWKKGVPLIKPVNLQVRSANDSLYFEWDSSANAMCFVLYDNHDLTVPGHIKVIIPGNKNSCAVPHSSAKQLYYLTAVNRIGMEGRPVTFDLEANLIVESGLNQ